MPENTVIVNGIRLHSAYNPQKEAERFVQSLECMFTPQTVLITEPACSYCLPFLRERFKNARILAVRYDKQFASFDAVFDQVLYLEDCSSLAEQLFSLLGEEGLSQTLFISWKPSEQAYPSQNTFVWNEIKQALLKSRDVLGTRTYFAGRWAKNACRFALYANSFCIPQKTHAPVVICASGPSLTHSLPEIQRLRSRMNIIAVSSALLPLVSYGITPDLIISTDGGYWAKPHLSCIERNLLTVPLALSLEAACPTQILNKCSIVPLAYGDGISQTILEELNIPIVRAERNGTVSGTAARLALNLTDNQVYVCGLDLACSPGSVHAKPNENENRDSTKDNRQCPKETRLTPTHFTNGSLELYRKWFSTADFNGRLHRLSDSPYKNQLGQVDTVTWNDFEKTHTQNTQPLSFEQHTVSQKEQERKEKLQVIISRHKTDDAWIKDALPALYIQKQRSSEKQTEDISIREAMNQFEEHLLKAIGVSV